VRSRGGATARPARGRRRDSGAARTWQRLAIGFDTDEEAIRAVHVLEESGIATELAGDQRTALRVSLDSLGPSAINRLLAEHDLHPAELVVRRASLESVFLDLTDGV